MRIKGIDTCTCPEQLWHMINTDKYRFHFNTLGFSVLTCEMKIIHSTHRTVEKL